MPERIVAVNDVRLHVVEEGSGPPVILCHGFPELAYSWRHQLPALAAAGYHAVAPDQRGYGRSSRPSELADYDILHLTGDLVGLLDTLDEERAVFVGHDWGAVVVWQLALLHPDRVTAVCCMSTPFLPRGSKPPTEALRRRYRDAFFYITYFQQPGVADADLGADPSKTMRRLLCGLRTGLADDRADGRGLVDRLPEPDRLPDWLSPAELDFFGTEFGRTGFTGGLNWYRNLDRNWELTPQLAGATVKAPSLFIAGALDPILESTPIAIQDGWLTDHRGTVVLEGTGHWIQQEQPDKVNAALLGFLRSLGTTSGATS